MKRRRLRVLYITTREAGYARNLTLIEGLSRHAEVRVVAPAAAGRRGFDRHLSYLWGMGHVIIRGLWWALRRRDDILVLGFLAQPLMPLFRPLWHGPIIADAFISVFDTLCLDRAVVPAGSWRGRLLRRLDRFLATRSDDLLFDTAQHRSLFAGLAGLRRSEGRVVPVGARVIAPAAGTRRRDGRFLVVFAGAFLPLQGVPVIVEAARLLQNEEIDFVIIGEGQDCECAQRIARKHGLDRVRFVGWQELPALDSWYHQADVILGIFGSTEKAQRVIPNKVFEAVSIGKPVITGDTPAVRELFTPGSDILTCPVNEPRRLAEAILWSRAHPGRLEEIGRAGRAVFQRRASADAIAAALQPVFDNLGAA